MTDADAADLIARLHDERSKLTASRAEAIVAIPISLGGAKIDIGLTAEGLLAATLPAPAADPVFPIELRTILVTVLRQALVVRDGLETEEDVVLIVCRSGDELLMRWFARVATALLAPAATGESAATLTAAILQLAQLFERAQRPGVKAVIGLWAELAVIVAATDRLALLRAWREKPNEPFDFAAGDDRLEIKARATASMTHYFSVDQLRPPHHQACVIVVPVQRQGGGASVHDLAEHLRQAAINDAALLSKIDRVILDSLGSSYSAAANERFDLDAAKAGLQLYESAAIPCVPTPLPDGVLSARLYVDLAYVPALDPLMLAAGSLPSLLFP